MARNSARPTSPHLTGSGFKLHYRWGAHMIVSILNRAMGVALATLGVGVMTWWLVAAASGEKAYATFHTLATGWGGIAVGVILTFAWLFHLLAGVRHFVLDAGAGFELASNRLWSIATLIGAALLTAGMWLMIAGKGLI